MKCGAFSLTESCLKQRQVLVLCPQGPESHIFFVNSDRSISSKAFSSPVPPSIFYLQHDYFVLYQAYIRAKRLMRILGENACGRGTSSQKIRRTKVEVSKSRSELIINRHMLRLMTTWNGGLGEICVRIDLAHACPLRQMTSPGVVTSRALCWSSPLTHMQIRNPSAIAMVGIFQLHSL